MKRILINIVLLFVALLLLASAGSFGILYALFYLPFHYSKLSIVKYWGSILYSVNVGIDSIGNVLLSTFLNNFAIIDKTIYPFGNVHHTISHVLAVNHLHYNNTARFGRWLAQTLDKIDSNHMNKSL